MISLFIYHLYNVYLNSSSVTKVEFTAEIDGCDHGGDTGGQDDNHNCA